MRIVLTAIDTDEGIAGGVVLADSITDTIDLMLRLTGRLTVTRADFLVPNDYLDAAELYYRNNGASRAIFGTLKRDADARLTFTIAVWQENDTAPTLIIQSLDSIFASFDLADDVAREVASEILCEKVEVGALRIDGTDALVNFAVYVGGNPAGRGISEVNIPVGRHEVIIAVPGPLGDQPVQI